MNMIMKKKMCTKSIVLCAVLFFVPMCCMDTQEAGPFLTKDIIDARIKPRFSLQDMSRFSRTCKAYSQLINLRNISPEDPICDYLKTLPYDTLTRLLGHCEITKNKEMFDFVRSWHAEIRDQDETMFRKSYQKIKGLYIVRSYKKCVSVEYVQKQRLKQLVGLYEPHKKRVDLLKTILQGSSFNILDHAQYCKKKSKGVFGYPCYEFKRILFYICCYDDPDLWLSVLGGVIESRAFKYIFAYAGNDVIDELQKRNAFIRGIDEMGGTIEYYLEWFKGPQMRKREEQLAREKYSYWHPPAQGRRL